MLSIKNPTYNHTSTLLESHLALRKLTIIDEIQAKIAKQSRTRITSKQILTTLCIDENSNNSMFKLSDIYNVKVAIRRHALESVTLIQALLQNLHRPK